MTLTDNGDGTGSLTGTPPAGSAGTSQFTLKAANGSLLDANADLYGLPVKVSWVRRLRDVMRFESPQALKAQLDKDFSAGKPVFLVEYLEDLAPDAERKFDQMCAETERQGISAILKRNALDSWRYACPSERAAATPSAARAP